jgi:hypothetical protein
MYLMDTSSTINCDSSTSSSLPDRRSYGRLTVDIQRQLLKDLEDPLTAHLPLREICSRRPEVYGTRKSSLRRAVQNKHQWYKKLKESHPESYWKLYSRVDCASHFDSDSGSESSNEEEEGSFDHTNQVCALWTSPQAEKRPLKQVSATPEAKKPATQAQGLLRKRITGFHPT